MTILSSLLQFLGDTLGANPNTLKTTDKTIVGSINSIWEIVYPVGSYYQTDSASFNPNTEWGGTWSLLGEGQVLLSASAPSATQTYAAGSQYGSNTHVHSTANHTLTIDQIPSHGHLKKDVTLRIYGTTESNKGSSSWAWGGYESLNNCLQNAGGGQPHNHGNTGSGSTMQLSTACYIWHRTA